MVIYSAEGVPIIHIKVDDSSYKYEEIMGDCNVYLEFALTEHVEIEPGAYILFQGVRYEMMTRENVAIQHNRNYEYKATFSGPQSRFGRYVMYNYQDGRLKFDMIGKPTDFLTMVLWNLNEREPNTWAAGDIVIKEERLVSFSHTNVRDALNAIAEAFDTEWSVTGGGGQYYINLRKNEFNKDNPLALGYGKNHGFKPGVGRFNYGAFGQVQKVWIDGGERNLSIGEYGYTTLHFPKDFTFSHDARNNFRYTIDGQMYTENKSGGFDSQTAIAFQTDAFGASVKMLDAPDNCVEASLDLTEYYPKRVGTVTDVYYLYKGEYLTYQQLISLEEVIWEEVQVDIVDATIADEQIEGSDNGLDYSKYLFSNNDPLVVIFQNGMLAGREFNATFVKEAKTRTQINEETGEEETIVLRPANRFELERTTIDGVDMPNAFFRPAAGSDPDKYIVTNCYLPKEYICDFAHFKGAELDALREACKFIRENKDPQFTFKGTVDDLYSRRNWLNISGKLILGGCVSFQDSSIQPTPIVTRIVGIKNYVNNPYAPELTLSNETVKGGMSSTIAKLKAGDEHVMERVKEGRRFSMRSFRDAKETIAMLAGTIDYFSEGINPITVETMSLLVGYEALQFKFWTSRACTTPFPDPTHYDPDTHMFSVDSCVIQHMTHGITDVMPSEARHYYDYMRWSMPHIEFGPLTGVDEQGNDNSSSAYYLYAKVDAANVAKADSEMTAEELAHIYGEFVLSKTKKDIKAKLTPTDTEYKVVDGVNTEFSYYYLLVGILNSEYEGGRSFAPMYGFTEVLPGQITTDVIRSASGDSYFDLANNQFALGNKLTYINNVLKLRGALVVTGAGEDEDLVPIGAWCGEYDPTRTYAAGDEVWAEVDGEVMTFRYVYATPSSGHYVTDTQYWIISARGKSGGTGPSGQASFQSTMFVRMNSTPTKPAATDGSFSDPSPANILAGQNASGQNVYWADGIPSGEEMLWATTRIFTSDGQSPQESSWHDPRQMTDTSTYDVEFAKKQTNDAVPAMPTDANRHGGSGTQIWFDPVLDSAQDFTKMYWRAEREKKNGVWTTWTILRIKGEKGDASPALTADLSNEVDGVAVGSDGVLSVSVPLSTSVSLYYGNDPETITGITPSVPSAFANDIQVTPNVSTGNIAIVIAADTDFNGVSVVDIPITVTSAKGSRTVTYTIVPIKEGEDGEVYKLMPDYNVVKGTRSGSSISYSPTYVKCTRMRGKGGDFGTSDIGYLRYSVNGGSTIKTDYNANTGVAVSSATTAGKIIFYWFLNSNNTGLLDQETVPIVVDGSNGVGVSSVTIYYGYSMTDAMPTTWTEDTHGDDTDIPQIGPGAWIWIKEVTTYTDGTTKTKYSKSMSGGSAPVSPFRGEYDSSVDYYGCFDRTDIVKYNGQYYRANPLAQTYTSPNQSSPFHNIAPGNTAYWLPFIGNYDNLATGFAFIEELIVQRLNTAGSSGRIQSEDNWLKMFDGDGKLKLEIVGDDIDLSSAMAAYPTTGASCGGAYSGVHASGSDSGSFDICNFTTPGSSSDSITVSIPQIRIDVETSALYDGYVTPTSGSVVIMRGSTVVSTIWQSTSIASDSVVSISARQVTLSGGGQYTIRANFAWSWHADAFSGESLTDTVSIYFTDITHANIIVHNSVDNIVRIGANGISINLINSFSAIFGVETSGGTSTPVIKLEGVSNSNQVGLRLTAANGLQINTGNGWKTPLTS